MSTIPASEIVSLNPTVLSVGGEALDMVGLMLTTSLQPPLGQVLSFASASAVSDYFGPSSEEAAAAAIYFGGFTDSDKLPGSLLMAQYNTAAVGAWLRGADVSALTLTQLQAISGTLSIVIDSVAKSGSPNLSGATSFSNAAQLIAIALNNLDGPQAASFTGSIATNVLTVSAVASGELAVGQFIHGTGVDAGLYITALGTGEGGTGTYTLSGSDTVSSEAMTSNTPGVTYDSVAGAFQVNSSTTGASSTIAYATGTIADDLKLTASDGAVLSQGAITAVPATFMDALVALNSNWATFMTVQDPDASGFTLKLAFSAWTSGKNDRFGYVAWDTETSPTNTLPATASFGYAVEAAEYSGTCLVWGPDNTKAAFILGVGASIDFEETNGRITYAFRRQAGLTADVTDATVATNLGGSPQSGSGRGNGYNFYGAYGAAAEDFLWLQRGFVTGEFAWFDSFINQIWLNNRMQLALLELFRDSRSIAFNVAGYTIIANALQDSIEAGLNFGAFAPGTISSSQAATVNADAGIAIASVLQTQGYFLQVVEASAAVRAARGPVEINFWYLDRGSVQSIALNSIAVQ
jgi:hypothetical protein